MSFYRENPSVAGQGERGGSSGESSDVLAKQHRCLLNIYKIFTEMGAVKGKFKEENGGVESQIQKNGRKVAKLNDAESLRSCYYHLLDNYGEVQLYSTEQDERHERCMSIVENKCGEEQEIRMGKKKFKTLYQNLEAMINRQYKFREAEGGHQSHIARDMEVASSTSKPKNIKACYQYLMPRYEELQQYIREQEQCQVVCLELFQNQFGDLPEIPKKKGRSTPTNGSKQIPLPPSKSKPSARRSQPRLPKKSKLARHSPPPMIPPTSKPVRNSPPPMIPPISNPVRNPPPPIIPPTSNPVRNSPLPTQSFKPVYQSPSPFSPPKVRRPQITAILPTPAAFVRHLIRPSLLLPAPRQHHHRGRILPDINGPSSQESLAQRAPETLVLPSLKSDSRGVLSNIVPSPPKTPRLRPANVHRRYNV